MRRRAFLAGLALCGAARPVWPAQPTRVVSLGGAVTEIVFALGEEGRLVGRDTTSTFPTAATELPDVGYVRRLSPEGVLSVAPDLILAEEGAGPPETVALLQEARVPVIAIPGGYDDAAVHAKIIAVATALGVPDKGAVLAKQVDAGLAIARAQLPPGPPRRVLFVLSLQGGRIMAAGSDTAAEGIIALAGGVNAAVGFTGYKTLSDEALAAAAPDVLLMMDNAGVEVSDAELFALPALRLTPAGQSHAVVRMDGLKLLGFGPRLGEAVTELSAALATAGG